MTSKDELRGKVENALRSKLWLTQVTDMTAPEHWQFYLTESGDLVAVDINEATDIILNLLEGEKLDPFDFVEPCEPNCNAVRHGYHQGQWDMATRMSTLNKEPNKGEDVDG